MSFDFNRPEEGDAINVASLQEVLDDAEAAVNDLDDGAIAHRSLGAHNVPSQVVWWDQVNKTMSPDLEILDFPFPGEGTVPNWCRLDMTGGTNTVTTPTDTVNTDYIELEIDPAVSLTTYDALLVFWSAHVTMLSCDVPAPPTTTLEILGVFQVQVQDGGGIWRALQRSERAVESQYRLGAHYDPGARVYGHIAVVAADLSTNKNVQGVRLVAAPVRLTVDAATSTTWSFKISNAALNAVVYNA